MALGSILGGIGSIVGGVAGGDAAIKAAKQEEQGITNANNFLTKQYGVDTAYLNPYAQTGGQANSLLSMMMSNPQQFQNQFQASPGYQYNLQQQQGAINNSMAAKGGLTGGNTLMALQSNASGLANQDYQNYITNLMGQQSVGLGAAGSLANLGQTYGNSIANNDISFGNAQAAGTVGRTQAVYGGITQGLTSIGSGISSVYGAGGSGGGAGSMLGGLI